MLTMMAHFMLDFRPILLLQLFSTPYHYTENRLLRKYILGLKPGFRIWGERFEGELDPDRITSSVEEGGTAEGSDGGAVGSWCGGGGAEGDGGGVVGGAVGSGGGGGTAVGGTVPAVDARVAEVRRKGEREGKAPLLYQYCRVNNQEGSTVDCCL